MIGDEEEKSKLEKVMYRYQYLIHWHIQIRNFETPFILNDKNVIERNIATVEKKALIKDLTKKSCRR